MAIFFRHTRKPLLSPWYPCSRHRAHHTGVSRRWDRTLAAYTAQFMCARVTDAASFARMVHGRPGTSPVVSGLWPGQTELVEPASVQHLPRKAAAKEEEQRVGQAFQVVPPAGRPAQVCMHAGVPHCAPACHAVG